MRNPLLVPMLATRPHDHECYWWTEGRYWQCMFCRGYAFKKNPKDVKRAMATLHSYIQKKAAQFERDMQHARNNPID